MKPGLILTLFILLSVSIGNFLKATKINLSNVRKSISSILEKAAQNPVSKIISNSYSFFYWLPRKTLPYDGPFVLFKNSSVDFIRWYQIPHNLPPYRYLDTFPEDFFCYGLPGNTLPLGNWDPFSFHLVDKNVVKKFRESELKHGRLAMLACLGFIVQEQYHPLYPSIGGLASTHMSQLASLSFSDGLIGQTLAALGTIGTTSSLSSSAIGVVSIDFSLVVLFLCSFELAALLRNWTRWKRNEYDHQFKHNIGIGNLKQEYENGDYSFDPLRLRPPSKAEQREYIEMELNHGRLAMVAFIGMLGQEYLTGLPVLSALTGWVVGFES